MTKLEEEAERRAQMFKDEEELRILLQERGAIHDCSEAGCELDPKGNKIDDLNPGALRPAPSKKLKDLYKKIKGVDYV